jgi:hypothetical protein
MCSLRSCQVLVNRCHFHSERRRSQWYGKVISKEKGTVGGSGTRFHILGFRICLSIGQRALLVAAAKDFLCRSLQAIAADRRWGWIAVVCHKAQFPQL